MDSGLYYCTLTVHLEVAVVTDGTVVAANRFKPITLLTAFIHIVGLEQAIWYLVRMARTQPMSHHVVVYQIVKDTDPHPKVHINCGR